MEFFHKQQLHKRVDQMGLGNQYFKPMGIVKKEVSDPLVFWFFGFPIFPFLKRLFSISEK